MSSEFMIQNQWVLSKCHNRPLPAHKHKLQAPWPWFLIGHSYTFLWIHCANNSSNQNQWNKGIKEGLMAYFHYKVICQWDDILSFSTHYQSWVILLMVLKRKFQAKQENKS
jgi:hypothetical protein